MEHKSIKRSNFFCSILLIDLIMFFCKTANIRLGEDVLKTSWKRLEDVFSATLFCLQRRLEDVLRKTTSCKYFLRSYLEDVLKTSLEEDLQDVSWGRLGRWKFVTLKISSRHLQDILEHKKFLLEYKYLYNRQS